MAKVLFSFDIEEFDMPLEYGSEISFEQQIAQSTKGTEIILDLLKKHNVKATFFSTVIFDTHAKQLITRLLSEGHELASHGYYHSRFEVSHLQDSRLELERLSRRPVNGYRMARMMPVDEVEVKQAGYRYNSSLNPVYLPGRYNNFFRPRIRFSEQGVEQLPASATPLLRIPLFWLTFHNVPLTLYKALCRRVITHDDYLNLYFHPWEFIDLSDKQWRLPWYVRRKSGGKMVDRFEDLICWMKSKNYSFSTLSDFLDIK